MTHWTASRISEAAAAWLWVPDDAESIETEDYQLIRYPDYYAMTSQVAWSRTSRPVLDLAAEVAGHVRGWGGSEVNWWVSAATVPSDTSETLRSLGGEAVESVDVLARDLAAGLPELGEHADVRVEVVHDEATLRASYLVAAEAWDQAYPDDQRFSESLTQVERDLKSRAGFQVVAFLDGQPVACGGCTMAGEVARLWGAATLESARHQGAYRGVLAERLVVAQRWGATLGLVKGRVETSAPILARAGFLRYGEEQCYRIPVAEKVA